MYSLEYLDILGHDSFCYFSFPLYFGGWLECFDPHIMEACLWLTTIGSILLVFVI
uniref:Uncharacterized protein n=1 Tax=Arundo donax TaxID=35708 RepID=A0A0A9CJJ8_ARUDO